MLYTNRHEIWHIYLHLSQKPAFCNGSGKMCKKAEKDPDILNWVWVGYVFIRLVHLGSELIINRAPSQSKAFGLSLGSTYLSGLCLVFILLVFCLYTAIVHYLIRFWSFCLNYDYYNCSNFILIKCFESSVNYEKR